MQWYVYLILISATAFLVQVAVELVNRPIRTIFRLRRTALERMLAVGNIALPKPRELAISSRQIFEYDQAVENVRQAQRTFRSLGARLLALGESEPAIRTVMALFGLNIVTAGQKLIGLSRVYAATKTDNDKLRHEIEKAVGEISTALAASRRLSRNDMIKFQLEPMYLRSRAHPRRRMRDNSPLGQQRMVSSYALPSSPLAPNAKGDSRHVAEARSRPHRTASPHDIAKRQSIHGGVHLKSKPEQPLWAPS
jgi:hypothetical protein